MNKRESEDISNRSDGDSGQIVPIYFIHVKWCSYCKTALPEWTKFSQNMNGKRVNGFVLECVDIDMTGSDGTGVDDSLRQKYNVESFPTVQMVYKKKTIIMDATPTEKTLNDFVNKMLV